MTKFEFLTTVQKNNVMVMTAVHVMEAEHLLRMQKDRMSTYMLFKMS